MRLGCKFFLAVSGRRKPMFSAGAGDQPANIGPLARLSRAKIFRTLHDVTPGCFGRRGNISVPGEAPAKKGVPAVSMSVDALQKRGTRKIGRAVKKKLTVRDCAGQVRVERYGPT